MLVFDEYVGKLFPKPGSLDGKAQGGWRRGSVGLGISEQKAGEGWGFALHLCLWRAGLRLRPKHRQAGQLVMSKPRSSGIQRRLEAG